MTPAFNDEQMAALRKRLALDESVRTKPYRDTEGKLSIGVGRNLDDVGLRADEINLMLTNDIAAAIADLDRVLPWWRGLSDARRLVLANMAFNLGISRLLGFKNMLEAAKQERFSDAADEMLDSKWAGQVGDRAKRLAAMMRAG